MSQRPAASAASDGGRLPRGRRPPPDAAWSYLATCQVLSSGLPCASAGAASIGDDASSVVTIASPLNVAPPLPSSTEMRTPVRPACDCLLKRYGVTPGPLKPPFSSESISDW